MTFSVIGFGARGQYYTELFLKTGKAKIGAICDIDQKRLDYGKDKFNIADEQLILSPGKFFAKGRTADLLIISTLDELHYEQAVRAIDIGYDILLEKPIANTEEHCRDICRIAKEKGVNVYICYVLRYAPFFLKAKELLDSGKLGELVNMSLTENVAYWHQAHSFVRGNWRRSDETAPMIVAKCCHDMDIISWFVNKRALRISSYGSLSYFKSEKAPKGSAEYCFECKLADECPYECSKFYLEFPGWLRQVGKYYGRDDDREAIIRCLSDRQNPYARCVYRCDNNVVDHQIVNILFEDDVTAQLTMTAFSKDCYREMHIHCTLGEIYGNMNDNVLHVNIFGGKSERIDLNKDGGLAGHGGGDALMIETIAEDYTDFEKIKNHIDEALESHLMAFSAEKSRVLGGAPVEIER